MLTEKGYFRAKATVAGALPLDGAIIRIIGAEENNRGVVHSLITDRDGVTRVLELPAPSRNFSGVPNPSEAPYSLYDLEITADGYYPKRIVGVSVFPGEETLIDINMIPNNNVVYDYPEGNLDASFPPNDISDNNEKQSPV